MNSILEDDTKFKKVNITRRNKELDYLLNKQDNIVNFLKKLKGFETVR